MKEVHVPIELDDYLGVFVEVTAIVRVYPGEPMVRYYPDGSGYPGSPPEAELVGMIIDTATDGKVEVAINQDDLYEYLLENEDLWIERAFEYEDDY